MQRQTDNTSQHLKLPSDQIELDDCTTSNFSKWSEELAVEFCSTEGSLVG
jgi:hypothetical protein